jgi:8-oxo-dGTP diphosphatase
MSAPFQKGTQMIVAVAVIRDAQGRILLQERLDKETVGADNKWNFTGGQIEFGETPEEALVRECREEIGCEVRVVRMVPLALSRVWENHDAPPHHVIVLSYVCAIVSGTPRSMISEVGRLAWYRREEIGQLPQLPGVLDIVDAALVVPLS